MNEFVFPALFALGLGLVTLYLVLLRLKTERFINEQLARVDELTKDLHVANRAASGIGKRLIQNEKYTAELENRLEEFVRNDPNRVSYTEASKLVELGAEVEDLMNSCGISRPEAELVSALSRKQMAQKQASYN